MGDQDTTEFTASFASMKACAARVWLLPEDAIVEWPRHPCTSDQRLNWKGCHGNQQPSRQLNKDYCFFSISAFTCLRWLKGIEYGSVEIMCKMMVLPVVDTVALWISSIHWNRVQFWMHGWVYRRSAQGQYQNGLLPHLSKLKSAKIVNVLWKLLKSSGGSAIQLTAELVFCFSDKMFH